MNWCFLLTSYTFKLKKCSLFLSPQAVMWFFWGIFLLLQGTVKILWSIFEGIIPSYYCDSEMPVLEKWQEYLSSRVKWYSLKYFITTLLCTWIVTLWVCYFTVRFLGLEMHKSSDWMLTVKGVLNNLFLRAN